MKVFVALSGGVDSAVAVARLKQAGHDVSGIYMRHRYQEQLTTDETQSVLSRLHRQTPINYCRLSTDNQLSVRPFSADDFNLPCDATSAIEVATFLKIPFYLLDIDHPFQQITDYFVRSYYCGLTPNPCIRCNATIKFGLLIRVCEMLGGESFSTGHYVRRMNHRQWCRQRIEAGEDIPDFLHNQDADQPLLAKGDSRKDQSYLLYSIDRSVLSRLDFPLGNLCKEETRQIADSLGLPVAWRKESQETCFAEDGQQVKFIEEYNFSSDSDSPPIAADGFFVSMEGKRLAPHRGYYRYTIGQRKGFGVGFGQRIFVQKIDPQSREVVLGPYETLARTEIRAENCSWHFDLPSCGEFRCQVKIRYRNNPTGAMIRIEKDGSMVAQLEEPCHAVAPGQGLVCYWDDRLLGGGTIAPWNNRRNGGT